MDVRLIWNELINKFEASYPFTDTKNPLVTETGTQTLTNKTLSTVTVPSAGVIGFGSPVDVGISRTGVSNIAVGNGTQGDATGAVSAGKFTALVGSKEFTVAADGFFDWLGRAVFTSAADGHVVVSNNAVSIGSRIKADALPTVASGGGTSPAVTAGSTPLAGSVNVGTGGVATSIVINFNGTAFPSAPFVVVCASAGTGVEIATASTTQLTITTSVAWPASTIVNWICISAK